MTALITTRRPREELTVTDQFCGAGGSSIGAEAIGLRLTLGLNHWNRAIETHATNFPNADHDCADISQVDPRRYPSTDILLTSPECTNHTTAKNHSQAVKKLGQWRADEEAERSRATMWDVPRWAEWHNYKLIIVENVVESRLWVMFPAWLAAMAALGYEHEIVYFNSAFAPADPNPVPQFRDRMYTIFWRRGMRRPDLYFPVPAWCPKCEQKVYADQRFKVPFETAKAKADADLTAGKRKKPMKRWGLWKQQIIYTHMACGTTCSPYAYPAINALDWTVPSQRIGDRKTPLKPKTMARLERGRDKFGHTPTLVPLSYPDDDGRVGTPITAPFPTQTGRANLGLAHPFLTQLAGHVFERDNSACRSRAVEEPLRTQTATMSEGVVLVPERGMVPFIAELRGGGSGERAITEPLSTVSAGGNHHMLVHQGGRKLIVSNYSPGWARPAEENPLGAVTGVDHHGLLEMPPAFIDTFNGNGNPRPVGLPLSTVTTLDRHGLLTGGGEPELPPIEDCYYRMLEPHEIQAAMAFGSSYIVTGNKREKVRQLGNGVTPPVMRMLLERCVEVLDDVVAA